MDYNESLGLLATLGFGFILGFLLVLIIAYVLYAVAYYKALKAVGYKNPWMIFIPFACNYALTDAAFDSDEDASKIFFGAFTLPKTLVNFWWVLLLFTGYVPVIGGLLTIALNVIFLGAIYTSLYSKIDGTNYADNKVLGYISSVITLIPIIKWIGLKLK